MESHHQRPCPGQLVLLLCVTALAYATLNLLPYSTHRCPVAGPKKDTYNRAVAWTLWLESRNDFAGMPYVAATIGGDAGWDPARYTSACFKWNRFACWNERSMYSEETPELHNAIDEQAWHECVRYARLIQAGRLDLDLAPVAYHRNDGVKREWIDDRWIPNVRGKIVVYTTRKSDR